MASAAALRAKIAIKSWSLCFYCASANSKQLREFRNSKIPNLEFPRILEFTLGILEFLN
ncbi:MAG: hypothetical protein SPI08_07540 [Campylobacter sp.]|nr:hypothetical protein [Campylobacter sp.]MCI7103623.1 hypothetical protein [Campylobacter sp.]MDY6124369.1 hypothetical protein [Campylobacter sp.]